jgi:hypothetical protein
MSGACAIGFVVGIAVLGAFAQAGLLIHVMVEEWDEFSAEPCSSSLMQYYVVAWFGFMLHSVFESCLIFCCQRLENVPLGIVRAMGRCFAVHLFGTIFGFAVMFDGCAGARTHDYWRQGVGAAASQAFFTLMFVVLYFKALSFHKSETRRVTEIMAAALKKALAPPHAVV